MTLLQVPFCFGGSVKMKQTALMLFEIMKNATTLSLAIYMYVFIYIKLMSMKCVTSYTMLRSKHFFLLANMMNIKSFMMMSEYWIETLQVSILSVENPDKLRSNILSGMIYRFEYIYMKTYFLFFFHRDSDKYFKNEKNIFNSH